MILLTPNQFEPYLNGSKRLEDFAKEESLEFEASHDADRFFGIERYNIKYHISIILVL
jgi:hypothetical protein